MYSIREKAMDIAAKVVASLGKELSSLDHATQSEITGIAINSCFAMLSLDAGRMGDDRMAEMIAHALKHFITEHAVTLH